jgi:2,4-dienoyl-CoA reductase-like NADH-dependent reductase (Old Yellow Enzyme family)
MSDSDKSSASRYPRIGSHRTLDAFREHLRSLAPDVPVDDAIVAGEDSPLACPISVAGVDVGNRWVIHPMEGWDAETDGNPSELTLRRWRNFGLSGAKLIWGGEAVAVTPEARANPNQLYVADHSVAGLARLRQTLLAAHRGRFGSDDDLLLGLQLTHSGRFSQPFEKGRAEPRVAFRHPVLDARVGVDDDSFVLTDGEVDGIIETFVDGAVKAASVGYQFVDVKHCHGYLLHEFLGAHTRDGRFGGSFENRTRILRDIVGGIRRDAPELAIGVRVSIFDVIPYRVNSDDPEGPGQPAEYPSGGYRWGFSIDADDPTLPALEEGRRFLDLLRELGIEMVNLTGGSPYYNPHVQRPALYPPSDGYRPPEDPLLGVARHLRIVRDLKREYPDLVVIGSALSYLQEYLPHVSQALIRDGWMDMVGLGRMVLSYWDLPADCLEKGELVKKRICRTFSDCTTGPRNGLISGCFPLDPYYRDRPEAVTLRDVKRDAKRS